MTKQPILPTRVTTVLLATLLASCGGGEDDQSPTPLTLARTVAYTQCQSAAPQLAQADAALTAAGVQPFVRGCATDGSVFPSACGTQIHTLRTIDIPPAQEQAARSIGYKSPVEFPSYVPTQCPP